MGSALRTPVTKSRSLQRRCNLRAITPPPQRATARRRELNRRPGTRTVDLTMLRIAMLAIVFLVAAAAPAHAGGHSGGHSGGGHGRGGFHGHHGGFRHHGFHSFVGAGVFAPWPWYDPYYPYPYDYPYVYPPPVVVEPAPPRGRAGTDPAGGGLPDGEVRALRGRRDPGVAVGVDPRGPASTAAPSAVAQPPASPRSAGSAMLPLPCPRSSLRSTRFCGSTAGAGSSRPRSRTERVWMTCDCGAAIVQPLPPADQAR